MVETGRSTINRLPLHDTDDVVSNVEVDAMTKVTGKLNFQKPVNLPGA